MALDEGNGRAAVFGDQLARLAQQRVGQVVVLGIVGAQGRPGLRPEHVALAVVHVLAAQRVDQIDKQVAQRAGHNGEIGLNFLGLGLRCALHVHLHHFAGNHALEDQVVGQDERDAVLPRQRELRALHAVLDVMAQFVRLQRPVLVLDRAGTFADCAQLGLRVDREVIGRLVVRQPACHGVATAVFTARASSAK